LRRVHAPLAILLALVPAAPVRAEAPATDAPRVVPRVELLAAMNATQGSYDDTLSIPDLRVTNERVMTYRLLDYGDLVAFDDIRGLYGRPTEGVLGVLFQLVGEGSVRWSRQALSSDGLQLARARATKGPFAVESTITVFPDGRVQKDLPPSRTDLAALEKRLLDTRAVRYRPLPRERAPAELAARP
jgi:hypothetical protein